MARWKVHARFEAHCAAVGHRKAFGREAARPRLAPNAIIGDDEPRVWLIRGDLGNELRLHGGRQLRRAQRLGHASTIRISTRPTPDARTAQIQRRICARGGQRQDVRDRQRIAVVIFARRQCRPLLHERRQAGLVPSGPGSRTDADTQPGQTKPAERGSPGAHPCNELVQMTTRPQHWTPALGSARYRSVKVTSLRCATHGREAPFPRGRFSQPHTPAVSACNAAQRLPPALWAGTLEDTGPTGRDRRFVVHPDLYRPWSGKL